jgi:hypothetical protein
LWWWWDASHGNIAGGSDVAKDECCNCDKRGHWAHECRKKKHDEELHVTQADEEDKPTLLLVSATITELDSSLELLAVHFDEGRLFVQLGDKESMMIAPAGFLIQALRIICLVGELHSRRLIAGCMESSGLGTALSLTLKGEGPYSLSHPKILNFGR